MYELAVDQHRFDVGDVFERVGVEQHPISVLAGFERAAAVGDAEDFCGIHRGGAQGALGPARFGRGVLEQLENDRQLR